jgi:hypothetical protein
MPPMQHRRFEFVAPDTLTFAESLNLEFVTVEPGGIDAALHDAASPTILMFSKYDCEPCGELKSLLADLDSFEARVSTWLLCEVTSVTELPQELVSGGIRHFPTLLLIDRGRIAGVQRGAVTRSGSLGKEYVCAWLERSLDVARG